MRAIIYPRIIRDSAGIADHGEHRKIVEGNDRLRTMRMDKGQQPHRQFHVTGVVLTLLTKPHDFEPQPAQIIRQYLLIVCIPGI